MENTINITNDDVLIIPITLNGVETGEVLEFDVNDIDLPLRYEEMLEKDRKNREWLRNKTIIINKKQDGPTKGYLSAKEEEMIKATKEFFEKEKEVYNIFLGERGVEKLLCGRKFGWTTLFKIDELIEKNILPHLDLSFKNLKANIMKKYSDEVDKNVI
jgi:hypothetical protein